MIIPAQLSIYFHLAEKCKDGLLSSLDLHDYILATRDNLPRQEELVDSGICNMQEYLGHIADDLPVHCQNCGMVYGKCYGGKILARCVHCWADDPVYCAYYQYTQYHGFGAHLLGYPQHVLDAMWLQWADRQQTDKG